jgi:hypothetical protein
MQGKPIILRRHYPGLKEMIRAHQKYLAEHSVELAKVNVHERSNSEGPNLFGHFIEHVKGNKVPPTAECQSPVR